MFSSDYQNQSIKNIHIESFKKLIENFVKGLIVTQNSAAFLI